MEEIKRKFEKIYDQYNSRVYRFIYLKVSSREIAEDLASEVFLKAWEVYQDTDRADKIKNAQAYIYQIARNAIADHYKGKAKSNAVAIDEMAEIVDTKNSVEENAVVNMEMQRVKEALKGLNDDYQNFVIWRYLDELSVPEIAQITGKTESNVRVGVSRALQAIRERLEV